MYKRICIAASFSLTACLINNKLLLAKCDESDRKTLLAVQVVHRHGARTPLSLLKAYDEEEKIWKSVLLNGNITQEMVHPEHSNLQKSLTHTYIYDEDNARTSAIDSEYPAWFMGKLTSLGQQQTQQLGKRLRKRYVDDLKFLPSELVDPKCINYLTTNFTRTMFSADNVVKGLYPKASIPLQLRTYTGRSHPGNPGNYKCAKRDALMKNEIKKIEENTDVWFEPMKLFIERSLNRKGIPWLRISESIHCYNAHHIPILENETRISEGAWDAFAVYGLWRYEHSRVATEEAVRLLVSPIIEYILETLQSDEQKFSILSGHDSTLLPLLASLEYDRGWPPYASYLVFEVWQDEISKEKTIQCFYNGFEVELFGELEPSLESFIEKWTSKYLRRPDEVYVESFERSEGV